MYSLPVSQTELKCYLAEVPTVGGQEFTYMLIQHPEEGNHPGYQATVWCNEDAENDDEMSDDTWYVSEVDLFDDADADPDVGQICFQRYHGDDVRIDFNTRRVYFPNLEYMWLPVGIQDPECEGFDTVEEYVQDAGLDLQEHV